MGCIIRTSRDESVCTEGNSNEGAELFNIAQEKGEVVEVRPEARGEFYPEGSTPPPEGFTKNYSI